MYAQKEEEEDVLIVYNKRKHQHRLFPRHKEVACIERLDFLLFIDCQRVFTIHRGVVCTQRLHVVFIHVDQNSAGNRGEDCNERKRYLLYLLWTSAVPPTGRKVRAFSPVRSLLCCA